MTDSTDANRYITGGNGKDFTQDGSLFEDYALEYHLHYLGLLAERVNFETEVEMKIAKDIQYNLDRKALFNKLIQECASNDEMALNGFIRLSENADRYCNCSNGHCTIHPIEQMELPE